MIKMIFVAHPISENVESNLQKVANICKEIHSEEVIPVFPSFTWRKYSSNVLLARAVNEAYFGKRFIDALWLYGDHLSNGMKEEIRLALKNGIKVVGKTEETTEGLQIFLQELKNESRRYRMLFVEEKDSVQDSSGDLSYDGSAPPDLAKINRDLKSFKPTHVLLIDMITTTVEIIKGKDVGLLAETLKKLLPNGYQIGTIKR